MEDTSINLDQLLYNYETWLYTHTKVANSTVALYKGHIKRAINLIGSSPTQATVDLYIANLRRKGCNFGYISGVISSIEKFADSLGIIVRVTRPPKKKFLPPETLSEAEIAIILYSTKTLREKAILSLLAYTGIRNTEFCNLKIQDIDIANGSIHVEEGKGNKDRTIGISGECLKVIMEYLKDRNGGSEDLLFLTYRNHLPLEPQDIRKIVRVVAKRAGFKKRVWPHLFRHSLATNMIDRGAHLLTIKDQLGHAFLDTTMTYIHRSKKALLNDYRQFAPSYL